MNAKRRSMGATRATGALFTLALAVHAGAAFAAAPAVCVTTNSQLASALQLASSSAVAIQLMTGTYDLKGTTWDANSGASYNDAFFAGSSLSGGYLNASCAAQNIDRDNTIVTDSSTAPRDLFFIMGDATIQGITFQLKNGLSIYAYDLSQDLPAGTQLTLRRNVFTQTIAGSYPPIYINWKTKSSSGGTIRLVNNLVYENSSTSDIGAVQSYIQGGNPTFEAINNTIYNNGGMMGGVRLDTPSTSPIYAYNNIIFGNGGTDLYITGGTNITLASNTVGAHSYSNTATVTGATSDDPKLDSNYEPITSPVSPSINTGVSSVIGGLPTTDLPGNPRQIGSEPDRGAYESNVNDLATRVVTNTNDSGAGSLRDAITQSNANNMPTAITFNLGSACPYKISPITALPAITAPIAFKGYSQAGAIPNDLDTGNDAALCVILDGSAHGLSDGLVVSSAAADTVSVAIDGLAFSGFSHGAITLSGGSYHSVTGSRVGGAVGGVALDPVANGIIIGPGVSGVEIGGDPVLTLMNVLGSATGSAIVMDGSNGTDIASHANLVIGNYIGVDWNTTTSAFTNSGNGGPGIIIAGPGNEVGDNYIGFNGGYGMELTGADSTTATIEGNHIGVLPSPGDLDAGNHGGIVIENGASNAYIVGNEIWYNLGTGVRVLSGVENQITANSIWSNDGLGIDLGTAGVDANDNDSTEPAGYPNNGLNFPVITGAIGGHATGQFSGTLTSKPGTYYLEFYASPACDASGHGEGMSLFATAQVVVPTAGADGQATASFEFTNTYRVDFTDNPVVTAIAWDSYRDTSEFSQCFNYTDDTIFANSFDN
jgi:hypothetical protein